MAFLTDESEIVTGLPVKAEHVKNLYDTLSGDIAVDVNVNGEISSNILELNNGGSIGPNLENEITNIASTFNAVAGDGILFNTVGGDTEISADVDNFTIQVIGTLGLGVNVGKGLDKDITDGVIIDVSDFAGNGLQDDGNNNLEIDTNAINLDNTVVDTTGNDLNIAFDGSPVPTYTITLASTISTSVIQALSRFEGTLRTDTIQANNADDAIMIDDSMDAVIIGDPSGTNYDLLCTGDIQLNYSSDVRLKKNIKPVENALDIINSVNGYEFDWKDDLDQEKKGHTYGLIAQEVEKVMPETVVDRSSGMKAMNYNHLFAVLVEAIKEQDKRIKELEENNE